MIAVYSWRQRTSRACRTFAVLIFVTIIWTIGDIVSHLTDSYSGQWFGEILRYLGGTPLPVALLVFVYRYCGKHISRQAIIYLGILPAVSLLLMITNDLHHIFFVTTEVGYPHSLKVKYGLFFWAVHLPYCYGLMLVSLATVVLEISRVSRHYRTQIIMLFAALLIPFVANILAISGVFGRVSLSTMSFPITFVLIALAMFRFKFLASNPIAYETVFQTIRDGVIILDHEDIIRDINAAAILRFNKKPPAIVGRRLHHAFSDNPEFVANYEERKQQEENIDMTITNAERYIALDVTPMFAPDGTLSGRIVTLHDVTDRKNQQKSLETMAFHDPLTRLANRRKFEEETERAMQQTWESGKHFAILYFDLNRFKTVNDTLGHDVGDELLKYVAARISSILRKPDLLARMGGDEFAVLLHDTDEIGVERVVERMLTSVERPFHIEEHTLTIGLSIGAAFYPADGKSLAQLLRHADSAMYRAKSQGGGLNLYSPGSELEN
jgi:diguanylate cyclase (GGDEF)-like protein/PAS domain S-box-containing protein